MSPVDIADAEFRAGLARRLADLGLIPPDPAVDRLPQPQPAPPADEDRAAA